MLLVAPASCWHVREAEGGVEVRSETWRLRTKGLADLMGRRADVVSRRARRGGELRQSDSEFLAELERVDEGKSQALRGRRVQ